MDHLREVVAHVLLNGGTLHDADQALRDYLIEKDSPRVLPEWRRRFVEQVAQDLMGELAERRNLTSASTNDGAGREIPTEGAAPLIPPNSTKCVRFGGMREAALRDQSGWGRNWKWNSSTR